MPDAASSPSQTTRVLAHGWIAVGLLLSAAGWATEGAWTWVLVLVGFACAAWGVFRSAQARRRDQADS